MSSTRAYSLMYRPAEGGPETPWTVTAESASYGSVRDELASWAGPRLHHGDLVRVEPHGSGRDLCVFDADRARLVGAPGVPHAERGARWLTHWEGPVVSAASMLLASRRVNRRRCILAAAACARTVLHHLIVSEREEVERVLIAAEDWCRGTLGFNGFVTAWWAAEPAFAAIGRRAARMGPGGGIIAEVSAAAKGVGDAFFASPGSSRTETFAAVSADVAGRVYNVAAAAGEPSPYLAAIVRRFIPLSVVVCAELKIRDPLPAPNARAAVAAS